MESCTLNDWQLWSERGCNRLPLFKTYNAASLPASWRGLADRPAAVLLESANGGRYSYLCDRPARVVVGGDTAAEILGADGSTRLGNRAGTPLDVLHSLLKEAKVPEVKESTFTGGWLGLFGYDLVRTWEHLPVKAARDVSVPLYALVEPAELFIFDHRESTLTVVVWTDFARGQVTLETAFANSQELLDRAHARWQHGSGRASGTSNPYERASDNRPAIERSFSRDAFCQSVLRAKEYIAAGDTYQVNLSLRESRRTSVAPEAVYEALRRVNPSPYMGLFRVPQFTLVCGSPELLVRLVDGHVSSRPIAGTRPRGAAAAHDAALSRELLANDKERAEHLMLVDLIRNDIGRVAEFGSVNVSEFMVLEHYSHVMHIVSQVEARLAATCTWDDVLRSMFPGGTITGCPKIRTMEIIEELEPVGRGFYTGALGWISYGGDMELNIVIRSMLLQDGVAYVQAGAGIVADSQPDRELDEALRKAQALWVALDRAADGNE
jgi:para-aminobenzoate synthetase component 1